MKRFKELFIRRRRVFMIAGVTILVAAFVALTVFGFGSSGKDNGNGGEITESNINPGAERLTETSAAPTTCATSAASTAASTQAGTTAAVQTTGAQTTTMEPPVPFATAAAPEYPADYQSQWDAGYLIAIHNPDYSYGTSAITLSDADRDLLERLCMGEFGSGGFIGAALIAQSVKDAMCFEGYSNVADVIKYCRYDGRTDVGTSDACRQAVRFVFDDNGNAVQHRLLYMYNPYLVTSSFHESQNFILSFQGVRFFDKR